jgi:glutathione synthase/RimK-type ligase-like ATP-grasp enzyme
MRLGFMSLNLNSEKGYFTEIARRAVQNGISCFRFVPTSINPSTMLVKGEMYDSEKDCWISNEFPVPSIIYDRCFYRDDSHSKQCMPIVSWLKDRDDIQFLGYGLPNKVELYEVLKHSKLSAYLPHSQPVSSSEDILNGLRKWRNILIKPINGSQGNGIFYLENKGNQLLVKTEKQRQQIVRTFSNKELIVKWLTELIKKKKYFIQPYLELSNQEACPFDVRVLLQKNEFGNWIERGRGIRIGKKDGIISNLSAGGTVVNFKNWIESMPFALQEYIQHELDEILTNIPIILEETFLPLFELGIDIGIDKNGAIWILDINSKPGRKVILATNPEISEKMYDAPLLYASFISQSEQKERKRYNEKTLSH